MPDQIKVKCGDCGFEFMSGALPENRRCKNQNPVCNSANISVVNEDPSTENNECQGCIDLLKETEELKEVNTKLTEDLKVAKAAGPKTVAASDIVFTLNPTDPFHKGVPLLITKKTKGGVGILEKYIQRAVGSQDNERADAARIAIAKILGVNVKKYLDDKEKKRLADKAKK